MPAQVGSDVSTDPKDNPVEEFERLANEKGGEHDAAASKARQHLDRLKSEVEAGPRSPGVLAKLDRMIERLEELEQQYARHAEVIDNGRVESERRIVNSECSRPRDVYALDAALESLHLNEMVRMKVRRHMQQELARLINRLYEDRPFLLALLEGGEGRTKH